MPRLYKKEKLCSATAIDQLFGRGGADYARLAYPLRAVARDNQRRHSDAPVAFLISVPKKRLRHAVDRVAMRRRIREAYRLNRDNHPLAEGLRLDVAFVYVADRLTDFATIERAMVKILGSMAAHFNKSRRTSAADSDSHESAD